MVKNTVILEYRPLREIVWQLSNVKLGREQKVRKGCGSCSSFQDNGSAIIEQSREIERERCWGGGIKKKG